MFPAALRLVLRNHPTFWTQARVLGQPNWTIHFVVSSETDQPGWRFAIRVPKKAAALSVARHLVQRRLREVVRQTWQETAPENRTVPIQCLISVKRPAVGLTSAQLTTAWQESWLALLARTQPKS